MPELVITFMSLLPYLHVQAAYIFLNLLCQQTKGILRFDWVSLGVLIGCEGRTVIPLSMFNLKITKMSTNIGTSQAAVSDDSLYDLALLILGGFRIHLATKKRTLIACKLL